MTGVEFCPSCGSHVSGGAFCTGCGSALPSSPVAVATTAPVVSTKHAPDALVGRVCPYCRFPLDQATETIECHSCHAIHHTDCWFENSGCAINGCAATAEPPPPAPEPPVPVQSPAVAAAWTAVENGTAPYGAQPQVAASPQRSGNWKPFWIGLAVVLVLAAAGTGLFFLLSHKHANHATTNAHHPIKLPPDPGNPPPGGSNGLLPNESPAHMTEEIRQLMLTWHQDIKAGDTAAAWDLYTHRRQQLQLAKETESQWAGEQQSFARYLDPSGVQVRILSRDSNDGVATIMVTGMTYSGSSSCSDWSGVTWVRYEGGRWRYDPGYETTPSRNQSWKRRTSQTLGAQCLR
jgi:hypothetical protein